MIDFKFKEGDIVFVSKDHCDGYPQGTICKIDQKEYMTGDDGKRECAYLVYPMKKDVEFAEVGFWHCDDCLRAIAWSVPEENNEEA